MLSCFLISFALLLQAPVRPTEGGTITGIVKTTDGKPATGVRVTARAKPDSLEDFQEGIAMSSIAQTDQDGRYRLESVPPGRYYIAAGNIDLPTFYPGTLDVAGGTVLQITPGAERTGINFTLADLSFSLAEVGVTRTGFIIPIRIRVEGGAKLPVFSPNGVPLLNAKRSGDALGYTARLDNGLITLPFPNPTADYEVRVLNLPEGFRVTSLTYGAMSLLTSPLRLGGLTLSAPSLVSPATLSITLSPQPFPPLPGANITGQAAPGARSVWLGDAPGFLYADGTFELRGVPPGPQVILASNENGTSMQPSGASIIVGDRDIDGIQLDPIPLLPREVSPATPTAHAPGTKIPLARLKGRLVSEVTQKPLRGLVNIVGWTTMVAYPVDQEGRFEIPNLLPGSYNLTASIFDYYTVNQTVVIGEDDSVVELRARPAY